jgi:adenine-specific DNA-methyltransferase
MLVTQFAAPDSPASSATMTGHVTRRQTAGYGGPLCQFSGSTIYGHFRSTWSNGSLRPLVLKPAEFVNGYRTDHIVQRGYIEQLAASITADLCYIDPPYMKRQYAANYHLIETLARGDEPPAIGISGLRPWRDQYSDFCTKTKIRQAFSTVLQSMDCPQFLISYSADGLLSSEELIAVFEKVGPVTTYTKEYPRFRSNDSELGSTVTEYLFQVVKG